MLKILITYAVQGEFVEIKWPEVEPYYVRTGIGKVKAAFHLTEAIRQVEPDLVLNFGTAGTVNHQVGDIFVCRKFVDRDMQKMTAFGLAGHFLLLNRFRALFTRLAVTPRPIVLPAGPQIGVPLRLLLQRLPGQAPGKLGRRQAATTARVVHLTIPRR